MMNAMTNGFELNVHISPNAVANLKLVQNGLIDATRETLNEAAFIGALEQNKTLERMFTLRNKYTQGSIWPKRGMRKGLVPPWASDLTKMFSTTGTNSPYLELQERGFLKSDPSVPSKWARARNNEKRPVRPKNRFKRLKQTGVWKPTSLPGATHRERVSVLLAIVQKVGWDGLIEIEKDDVLPAGYYEVTKGKLKLLRVNQKGAKSRKKMAWHKPSIARSGLAYNLQRIFNSKARIRLGGLF